MKQLTAIDVLLLIQQRAQNMRENGEADMRSIIWVADYLIKCAQEGKDRNIVISEFEEEDDA
jgi:hypothetical protein